MNKKKIITSLIIFDLALSASLGVLPSNLIISLIVTSTSSIVLAKLLHKLYLKTYPKETITKTIPEEKKSDVQEISPTPSRNLKLSRILKRKL